MQQAHVFGLVGDGINLQFVGARHEEAAAFMAGGFVKHTGKLGVCLGTTGPGAIHLRNGLYDAHYDGAPVLAITGTTFHVLIGTRFMQGVDTVKVMDPIAELNVQITDPAHASIVVNHACRTAFGNRCVAHVTIPKDLQAMKLSAGKRPKENHGLRKSESWIAETLGAPYTTGGIGHLGTQPSQWIIQNCDTLLILGSTMPWIDRIRSKATHAARTPSQRERRSVVAVG